MELTYPLLIDGGLSNVLEQQGHDLKHKLWTARLLDQDPESIVEAHLVYLMSGARCITTSSYQATIPGLLSAGFHRNRAEALISRSVQLAEAAIERAKAAGLIDHGLLIAASIGPYGAYLADGSEYRGNYGISDESLREFHLDRISILDRSNADFFACETIPSYQEAKVLSGILEQSRKQAWISFSCKDEQHINDGTKMEDCASLFSEHPNVFALGVNCTSPEHVSGLIKVLKSNCGRKKIVVYPNSGEAYNASSKTWLGISDPELFLEMAKEWIRLGADIIGGCCRIGPEHIKMMSNIIKP
jgi:homocysteine S-methyltransferase